MIDEILNSEWLAKRDALEQAAVDAINAVFEHTKADALCLKAGNNRVLAAGADHAAASMICSKAACGATVSVDTRYGVLWRHRGTGDYVVQVRRARHTHTGSHPGMLGLTAARARATFDLPYGLDAYTCDGFSPHDCAPERVVVTLWTAIGPERLKEDDLT